MSLPALAQEGPPEGPAQADAPAQNDEEARGLFHAGEAAYAAGRFADAEGYFRQAHAQSGRDALLYNLGLSAEQARHDEAALEAYRRFVAALPDSDLSPRARVRIAALEAHLLERETPVTPESDAAVESDDFSVAPVTGSGGSMLPWITVGVSGAVLVTGAVLVGLAASDVSAVEGAERGASWSEVMGAYDRSEPMSIAGFVMLGVGAAGVAAGLVWALMGDDDSDSMAQLRVGPLSLALEGSFR